MTSSRFYSDQVIIYSLNPIKIPERCINIKPRAQRSYYNIQELRDKVPVVMLKFTQDAY